jgi:hypothetical protein
VRVTFDKTDDTVDTPGIEIYRVALVSASSNGERIEWGSRSYVTSHVNAHLRGGGEGGREGEKKGSCFMEDNVVKINR